MHVPAFETICSQVVSVSIARAKLGATPCGVIRKWRGGMDTRPQKIWSR